MPAFRMLLVMTVLTGIVYPIVVTLIGQALFHNKVNGSLIEKNGKYIGSQLISQKFVSDRYFKSRPSAGDYNPLPSGGTNLGPTSKKLKDLSESAKAALGVDAPQDLIFASASGLDPHISPAAAQFQIERVVKARGLNEAQRASVVQLVQSYIEKPDLGFIGVKRVNVLKLNLAVDAAVGVSGGAEAGRP